MKLKLLLLLMFVSAFNAAQAGVYKWTDEKGQVHFGDNPQGSAKPERVKVHTSPPVDPETLKRAEEQKRYIEARKKERTTEEDAQDKLAKQTAANKEYCEKSKSRLAMLERGGRMYSVDASGERSYLNEDGRQAEMVIAKEDVMKYCK